MVAIFPKLFPAGFRLINGSTLNSLFNGLLGSLATENGITASTTQTQAGAYGLTANISRITTVANASDSVRLPPAKAGLVLTVINDAAANSMNVFPATGDNADGAGVNTAQAQAAGKRVDYYCPVDGIWCSAAGVKTS